MKVKIKSKYTRKLIILFTGIISIMMVGCAEFTKKEPLSETEACNRINEIIADHPNNFEKHKKHKKVIRHFSVWSTESPFPTAQNCEIWEWSTGLHSFICSWDGKDGMNSANISYKEGNQIIQSCLGDQWQAKSSTTSSGGLHTRYSKSGLETIVSIRYFKSTGLFDEWTSVLYIGDKNNLSAKTH